MTRAWMSMLGRYYFYLRVEDREKIERSLWGVLRTRVSENELPSVIRRTFEGIISHYYEKIFMAYTRFEKVCRFLNQRVAVGGIAYLDEALAQGKGVILVTGHYGAVEFLPLTLALKGYPVTMLLRFKTERLKDSLNRRAQNVPITLVDVAKEENVVFTALKALRSNQILITECDEFDCWKPHRSERAWFLGSSIPMDRSLDMLQGRSKAPVVMGLMCRQAGNRFDLELHPLRGEGKQVNLFGIARQAMEVLERYVYQAPEQWYQWKAASRVLQNIPTQPPERRTTTGKKPVIFGTDSPAPAC